MAGVDDMAWDLSAEEEQAHLAASNREEDEVQKPMRSGSSPTHRLPENAPVRQPPPQLARGGRGRRRGQRDAPRAWVGSHPSTPTPRYPCS